jgi:hypothetical protein
MNVSRVYFTVSTQAGQQREAYCNRHARFVRAELTRDGYAFTESGGPPPRPLPRERMDQLLAAKDQRDAERARRQAHKPFNPDHYRCDMWYRHGEPVTEAEIERILPGRPRL